MAAIESFTLPSNGLRVVLYPLRCQHVVAHCSFLGIGSSSENKNTLGTAHLLEHMIFKGTRTPMKVQAQPLRLARALGPTLAKRLGPCPPTSAVLEAVRAAFPPNEMFTKLVASGVGLNLHECDIDGIARLAGARVNAYTSTDLTSYHFTTLGAERMTTFFAIMADCLEHLNVTDDHIASEMRAVLEELKRGNDNTVRVALAACSPLLFEMGTAGHHATIGDEMVLMRTSARKLLDFHAEHYQPYNCTVSVAGGIGDVAAMRKVITETFSAIGCDNYVAHRAVKAVQLGSEVPAATRAIVQQLANAPLRRALQQKLDGLMRAHVCQCTTPFSTMRQPKPLPTATHRTIFDHNTAPIDVFGFRIAGWRNDVHVNVWTGVCELLTGSASARLPSTYQSYVDRHADAGALYLICTNASHAQQRDVLCKTITRAVTAAEATRVQNAMRVQRARLNEDVDAFGMHLVECLSQQTMPSTAAVTRAQLQAALNTLSLECIQHVTVTSPPSVRVRDMLQRRNTVRAKNATLLKQIKQRLTPLEDAHAVNLLPPITPMRVDALPFPQHAVTAGNDSAFVHAGTHLCHFAVLRPGDPSYGVHAYGALLAARTRHYGVGTHYLEGAGVAFELDDSHASLSVAGTPDEARPHIAALLNRMEQPLDAGSFDRQRAELISELKADAVNPVTRCLHEATNRLLRQDAAYSYDDAIAYVSDLTPRRAERAYARRMDKARHVFVRPAQMDI